MAERNKSLGAGQTTGHSGREPNLTGSETQRGGQHETTQGVIGNVMEGAQNVASSVADTAGQAWEATRQGAQQLASTVSDVAGPAFDNVRDFLRRYPIATLAAGIGLGIILSMALRGSRSA